MIKSSLKYFESMPSKLFSKAKQNHELYDILLKFHNIVSRILPSAGRK